jgi:hypothetical protein
LFSDWGTLKWGAPQGTLWFIIYVTFSWE